MAEPVPKPLTMAVCIFEKVTALDYQGPMDIFGFAQKDYLEKPVYQFPTAVEYAIEPTYFGTSTSVKPFSGPTISIEAKNVYSTFLEGNDDRKFDIILVPGGLGTRVIGESDAITQFIKKQSDNARYILGVCTGVWLLALGDVLSNKRATTNKAAWAKKPNKPDITWVEQARWVVNDKGTTKEIWTSSGVSAGMDMANAFLAHLIRRPNSELVRHVIEQNAETDSHNDPFAEYWGLVDDLPSAQRTK